ncbi:hypothetical protein L210DRAFT_3508760 [Boletus edulis BED1]|uniref:BTB domain-containing protein n=1 Tax=Boletus edulis BED1 TaxID=1328754 RepID=A0AAD4G832_BOLED|nr:hypothetical protein L210DRAFT_3508760 [Boletus edulis BED1]
MTDAVYAAAPFDHAKADIILRSSDNVDFRVFKLFLSLASPFFETLFDIPQPAEPSEDQEVKDGLAVVPVIEDSKTLDALLRFCYPCTLADDPTLEVLQDALDVLEAARKYSLDSIEKKARQAISSPKILEVEPLRCFAIAHRGRLREETLLAAKQTLSQPLIPGWFQEIELISAADLLALLTYHKKCGDAIASHYGSNEACTWLLGRYTITNRHGHQSYNNCNCPRGSLSKYWLFGIQSPQWWENFMEETFKELRDKPCKETVQAAAEKAVQSVRTLNCQTCSATVTEGMHDLSDLFVKKVDEVVSRIELELNF